MNEKEYKEKMYAKIYDSVGFLVTNHSFLPKSIGKVNLKLTLKFWNNSLF